MPQDLDEAEGGSQPPEGHAKPESLLAAVAEQRPTGR